MRSAFIAACVGAIGVGSTAYGQAADQVVIYGCQAAAAEVIRTPIARADTIRFSANSRIVHSTETNVLVRGEGAFQRQQSSNWHEFAFDCAYDARSGEAYDVKVHFRPNGGARDESRRGRRRTRGAE